MDQDEREKVHAFAVSCAVSAFAGAAVGSAGGFLGAVYSCSMLALKKFSSSAALAFVGSSFVTGFSVAASVILIGDLCVRTSWTRDEGIQAAQEILEKIIAEQKKNEVENAMKHWN